VAVVSGLLISSPGRERNSNLETGMDSNEKWYAVKEVAARYGVSEDTIRRRIRTGIIRALLFRRSQISSKRKRKFDVHRISESELQRFERANFTN
jgi:transposase